MDLLDHLLAGQTEAELVALRDQIVKEIQGQHRDLGRTDRAIAAIRSRSPEKLAPGPPRSDLRHRVITLLELSNGPLSPKDMRHLLRQQGGPAFKDTQLYNILSRMARDGELARDSGFYELPSRNGTEPGAANGSDLEPLTAPTSLAGGYGRQSALAPTDGSG
jgi:hypothetical protein